jgi:thymidylate kinase
MLITVSGMVGSGKSTTAAVIVEVLAATGLNPRYLRFRYLKLFGFARHTPGESKPGGEAPPTTRVRGSGFALRRLTAARTIGYAARILAFRLSGVGTPSRCDVLDRYFYDNFVHYELNSRRERLYASVLRRLIPTPDVSILLVASDRTISTRRSHYAPEYLVTVARRYEALPNVFPHLIRVSTDPGGLADQRIRQVVQALMDGTRRS